MSLTRIISGLVGLLVLYVTCADNSYHECSNFEASGCSCASLGIILGITCTSDANMLTLPEILDSTFGVNGTYEITLRDFPTLPPRVVDGLLLFRFIVDGSETSSISDQAFDGITWLRWFHVYLSSLTRVPHFSNIAHTLRQVNIDNSLVSKVDNEFQNLPFLTRLSLRNNTVDSVQADAFQGTTNIEFLDLSFNKLSSLPENIFDGLKNIMKLNLGYNRLHTLRGLFDNNLLKLRFLRLDFNNLSNVDDIFQTLKPSLVSLCLSNNPLRSLRVQSINSSMPPLQVLTLNNCDFTEFTVEHYLGLPLRILDLRFNKIKHVGEETIDFGEYLELMMDGNGLESFSGTIGSKIKDLFLADNNIRRLGDMLKKTFLSSVNLSRNRLTALKKDNFFRSGNFQVMIFRHNDIESIDSLCFESTRTSLESLDLSFNKLTNLNGGVKFLSVLRTLNVSNNFLETLSYTEFNGMNELSSLYLQNNKIVSISDVIQYVPRLRYLILKNNNVTHLDMNQIPGSLQYFDLKGNPFKCTCQLYHQFLKRLRNSVLTLDTTPCKQASESENTRHRPCPSACSCRCDNDDSVFFARVSCSSGNLKSVPVELTNGMLQSYSLEVSYKIDDPEFDIYDQFLALNLSNNRIETLGDLRFSQKLRKLYLANNLLTALPYHIMELPKLQEVTLSGNPWKCDCDDGKAIEFRNWLLPEDRQVLDKNEISCTRHGESKVIVTTSEANLCPSETGMYLIIAMVVIGLLIAVLIGSFVYTKYKVTIIGWFCPKKIIRVHPQDTEVDRTFDFFIFFSEMDRNFFLDNMASVLESRYPGIHIYHKETNFAEDFLKEKFRLSSHLNSSKITILIVTGNFLADPDCMSSMPTHKKEHDEFHPIIVIKVGDLPSDCECKVYVDLPHATYLEWDDQNFWNKFTLALPQPLVETPPIQMNINPCLVLTSEL